MEQISAAENHTIHLSANRWRLLFEDRPLAEATGNGFRYGARFCGSRRLNADGLLAVQHLLQVVLGWQHTDEAWHLGIILEPELADQRGSRWVELVYWPDPEGTVFQELAEQTGRALSKTLNIPFYMIPPQPIQVQSPAALLDLPQTIGVWTMERVSPDKRRFVIKREGDWLWQQYSRIAWNLLWVAVYLGISLATLFGDIALPNTGTLLPDPRVLPYIGLATALMLAGNILYAIWQISRKPDRIFIDGVAQTISAWKGQTMHWQIPAADIQSVYVSETIKKKGDPRNVEYGELNLHLGGGEFHFLLNHEELEDNTNIEFSPDRTQKNTTPAILELTPETAYTRLQTVGLYVAGALGDIPAWYDVRPK